MATRITRFFSSSNIPTHIQIDCNSTFYDIRKFVELCDSDENNRSKMEFAFRYYLYGGSCEKGIIRRKPTLIIEKKDNTFIFYSTNNTTLENRLSSLLSRLSDENKERIAKSRIVRINVNYLFHVISITPFITFSLLQKVVEKESKEGLIESGNISGFNIFLFKESYDWSVLNNEQRITYKNSGILIILFKYNNLIMFNDLMDTNYNYFLNFIGFIGGYREHGVYYDNNYSMNMSINTFKNIYLKIPDSFNGQYEVYTTDLNNVLSQIDYTIYMNSGSFRRKNYIILRQCFININKIKEDMNKGLIPINMIGSSKSSTKKSLTKKSSTKKSLTKKSLTKKTLTKKTLTKK